MSNIILPLSVPTNFFSQRDSFYFRLLKPSHVDSLLLFLHTQYPLLNMFSGFFSFSRSDTTPYFLPHPPPSLSLSFFLSLFIHFFFVHYRFVILLLTREYVLEISKFTVWPWHKTFGPDRSTIHVRQLFSLSYFRPSRQFFTDLIRSFLYYQRTECITTVFLLPYLSLPVWILYESSIWSIRNHSQMFTLTPSLSTVPTTKPKTEYLDLDISTVSDSIPYCLMMVKHPPLMFKPSLCDINSVGSLFRSVCPSIPRSRVFSPDPNLMFIHSIKIFPVLTLPYFGVLSLDLNISQIPVRTISSFYDISYSLPVSLISYFFLSQNTVFLIPLSIFHFSRKTFIKVKMLEVD